MRFFASLRMTGKRGLRATRSEGLTMTYNIKKNRVDPFLLTALSFIIVRG
jgi:hypothetical protein